MTRYRNFPFVLRGLFLLCVALIPLVIYFASASPVSDNLKEIAQRTAREYDRLLRLRQQQVFTFAAFPSLRAFAASTPETRTQRAAVALNELQSLVASDTGVREAFMVDTNGKIIMTTLDGWDGDVSARQFVQDALRGQLVVSPVAFDRNEYSIYYAAPVLNNSGDVAGALVLRAAAQELWDVLPRGENWYTVLTDENGVRLDDTGDPARRLFAFGALDAARATQISRAQMYGAQMPQVRATNMERVQQLVTQGAFDQLRASDFNAGAFAYQRLASKPWTVLAIAPQPAWLELVSRFALPLFAAFLLALGGAFLFSKWNAR